jgi:hypothetical protein
VSHGGTNRHPEEVGESSTPGGKMVSSSPKIKEEQLSSPTVMKRKRVEEQLPSSPVIKRKRVEKQSRETQTRRKLQSPIQLDLSVIAFSKKDGKGPPSPELLFDSVSPVSDVVPASKKGLRGNELSTSSPAPHKSPGQGKSYQNMSTQALYAGEVDKDLFDAEMDFELPPSDDEVMPPSQNKTGKPKSSLSPITPIAAAVPISKSPAVPQAKPPTAFKSDPDGIEEMQRYLAYCENKFHLRPEQVIFAVERTGGVKRLMEVVLEAMSKGRGLPVGLPGVWTEDEDAILMGSDSRVMKKLSETKGANEMSKRMEFLNLWNMA